MDPVIAAQVRLEEAVHRLEQALATRGKGQSGHPAKATADSAELATLRAERVTLQATKRAATERLDAAIGRLKGLIES